MSYRVQSLERGIDILGALASGPKTVTEITRELDLAKGTAFRLLASLGYEEFVVREPSGIRYMLGPGLLPLMQNTQATFGWIGALAGEVLHDLWERVGETVVVHVRVGHERVCVHELPSAEAIRYVAPVGSTDPIHVGSAGKVLLAALSAEELDQLLPKLKLQGITERSITDRERLREEVELARSRGWATSAGERIDGSASLSVPVRIPGEIWASLSVLGPANRLTPERTEEFVPLIGKAARRMQRLLEQDAGEREPARR
ncbi:MAG: IclR family transcriptional regulator [Actinobacteria bacterium]|nr:IclR family transcriptional regulator [Actinomycetota bacterium]